MMLLFEPGRRRTFIFLFTSNLLFVCAYFALEKKTDIFLSQPSGPERREFVEHCRAQHDAKVRNQVLSSGRALRSNTFTTGFEIAIKLDNWILWTTESKNFELA